MIYRLLAVFFFGIIYLYPSQSLRACDVCGSGISGSYLGILPNFSNNLVGVRHQFQRFDHSPPPAYSNGLGSRVVSDYMYRSDVWLRVYPSSRWQLLAFVPYQVHVREETNHTSTIQGVGDIRLRGLYSLVNTGDSIEGSWKHTLLLGSEIKLPTGPYQQRDPVRLQRMPEIFQIGTGAYSFSPNVMYTLRHKAWGIFTDMQYTYNTTNELQYRWGDQFFNSVRIFYWKNSNDGRHTILPSLGYSFEYFAPDTDNFFNMQIQKNGGMTSLLYFGLDYYSDKWMMQLFAQKPIMYELAEEVPVGQWRMGFSIGMFF